VRQRWTQGKGVFWGRDKLVEKRRFFADSAVRIEEHFFGREKEVKDILDDLERGLNVSIVAARGVGKTSLLRHISKPKVLESHNLSKNKYRFIYVNCSDLTDFHPSEFRAKIVERAKQEIPEVVFAPSSAVVTGEGLKQFFKQVVDTIFLYCVIILDHFESVIQNSLLDHDFLDSLRNLNKLGALNNPYPIRYVVVSRESLYDLEKKWLAEGHPTSPFFNIFTPYSLTPFNRKESHDFLQRLFEQTKVSVPKSVIDLILGWAQGFPSRLQTAVVFTVNLLNDNKGDWNERLAERLRDKLANLLESNEPHCNK
jgi:AAA+ ATPase superfamily predicted ATPase